MTCHASEWLKMSLGPKLTATLDEADKAIVAKAIRQNFQIERGESYIEERGTVNGRPFVSTYLLEIQDLCARNDLFQYEHKPVK